MKTEIQIASLQHMLKEDEKRLEKLNNRLLIAELNVFELKRSIKFKKKFIQSLEKELNNG